MARYAELHQAVLKGDAKRAAELARGALAAGAAPEEIVNLGMIPAMTEAGRRFACNEYFVPELLIAARAMKAALEVVKPLLAQRGVAPLGRIVMGTVSGDLHDIGKSLVASLLEGGGFEVVDLGVNVSPQRFAEAVRESGAELLGLSALLTTTMPMMKATIEGLVVAGVRERVRVIVGGAPITPEYAEAIGADGFAPNGHAAVELARRLLGR
jgi:5-methyltetrahydrofolate--homocysteine methyltransferase